MSSIKGHFILDPNVTFLNHGSFGATPKTVFAESQRWQRELENQPVEFLGHWYDALMARSRAVPARESRIFTIVDGAQAPGRFRFS